MRAKPMKSKSAMATCVPRLVRGGGCRASTARPAASVSLLERIRDVVLRLIMLSAVSRASSTQRTSSGGGGGGGRKSSSSKAPSSPGDASRHRHESGACVAVAAAACRRDDSIVRNEAVEDCIEFLKRSSADGDAAKLSTVSDADAGEDKDTGTFFILNVEAPPPPREVSPSPSSGCR